MIGELHLPSCAVLGTHLTKKDKTFHGDAMSSPSNFECLLSCCTEQYCVSFCCRGLLHINLVASEMG
jgi:hypothetical protein